jgi:hypothetical protein
MKALRVLFSWAWRLAAAGAAHAVGVVLGGGLALALALTPPSFPQGAEFEPGVLSMVAASLVMAIGLAALASSLAGGFSKRWLILAAFAFVVNGLGTSIEAEAFTTLGGFWFGIVANLPASVLGAFAVASLFSAPSAEVAGYFSRWSPGRLTLRLVLALAAFPFAYFLFGMMIAPIVTPYYEEIDFLLVPPLTTLLQVLWLRSALFLAVSWPVIAAWSHSRTRLALALCVGHFTAVGLSGLIQASFFPAVMRWTHGVEILADSALYAALLVWLLYAPPAPKTALEGTEDEKAAALSAAR